MKTQSKDTRPEAEKFLIELLRQKMPSEKFRQILSLSQTVAQLSKRAIARQHPDLNKQQITLLFIKYHYGEDLAERVKKYLDKRSHEDA
ncbi:MAG: hypothetical protein GXO76_02095 [Calditrichaeota bacterium]|nr:hypothetical protein [Calditrichota bacterium]